MAFKMKNPSMAKLAKQAGAGSPMKKNGDDKKKKPMFEPFGPQSSKPKSKPLDFDPSDRFFGPEKNKNNSTSNSFNPEDAFFGIKNKKKLNKSKRNVRPVEPVKSKRIKKIDYK